MKTLKEMAYFMKNNGLDLVNTNGMPVEKSSKLWTFYNGIRKEKHRSDDEASADLYGVPGSGAYRKLKATLLECMVDSVARLDTQQDIFTDYQRSYYECHKEWYVVRILTGQHAHTAALNLAQRLLKKAAKYEFTLLCMDVTSYLRIQYSLRDTNENKYHEANKAFDYYRALYDAETLVEHICTSLSVQSENKRANYQKLKQDAEAGYGQVAPLLKTYQSYKIQMYGRLVELILHTARHDYQATLLCCGEAIDFFEQRLIRANTPLQVFRYEQLVAQLQLRAFDDAFVTAKHCAEIMPEGSFNWFKYRELFFLLLLHSGQWSELGENLSSVLNHPRFGHLPNDSQEIWRVYEAYTQYLMLMDKTPPNPDMPKFKISKFVNDTHLFSKDKIGINISILVIHYLFLLRDGRRSQMLERVSTLEHYCYRYLMDGSAKRSFVFFKMLLLIPACQFHPSVVRQKAQAHIAQLKEVPLGNTNQVFEVEIIPYEQLWELALESLSVPQMKLV